MTADQLDYRPSQQYQAAHVCECRCVSRCTEGARHGRGGRGVRQLSGVGARRRPCTSRKRALYHERRSPYRAAAVFCRTWSSFVPVQGGIKALRRAIAWMTCRPRPKVLSCFIVSGLFQCSGSLFDRCALRSFQQARPSSCSSSITCIHVARSTGGLDFRKRCTQELVEAQCAHCGREK
jgi:hypothetical protein